MGRNRIHATLGQPSLFDEKDAVSPLRPMICYVCFDIFLRFEKNMAVPKEKLNIEGAKVNAIVKSLHRNPSGEWTLVLQVDDVFTIDDDRTIPFNVELRTKSKQVGFKRRNGFNSSSPRNT